MPQRAIPPAESDVLCESCGYILNGLDPSLQPVCPECGTSVAESLDPARRRPAPIEEGWSARTFWQTTWRAIVGKRRFYSTLLTRTDTPAAIRFGRVHRFAAAAAFGVAATFHLAWFAEMLGLVNRWSWIDGLWIVLAGVVLIAASLPLLYYVTRLASFLTTAESRFWGLRLPGRVVHRAMNFHAANYLPVAAAALIVTVGYRLLLATGIVSFATGVAYLVTLSVLIVLSAVWLFESYVVAMRRIRLANF